MPSGSAGFEHWPDAGSHVPGAWHSSLGEQSAGGGDTHAPAEHVSPVVHASPSSHAAPSPLAAFTHCPVIGSHAPSRWHESGAEQSLVVPAQVPAVH